MNTVRSPNHCRRRVVLDRVAGHLRRSVGADESGWVDLIGEHGLDAWRKPTGDWIVARRRAARPEQPKRLAAKPGQGTLVNGTPARPGTCSAAQDFGDLEAHFEFLVPKGSNSGVKFEGLYEIQIADSFGVAKPTASHCGGIYPRAEMLPRYHHIDDGTPPRVNAARPAGEWQTLDVIFRAPRFDPDGKKIEERPLRQGGLERPGDPRERRGQDADRPCLAASRKSPRADSAPRRPRAGGVPQHPGPAACDSHVASLLLLPLLLAVADLRVELDALDCGIATGSTRRPTRGPGWPTSRSSRSARARSARP